MPGRGAQPRIELGAQPRLVECQTRPTTGQRSSPNGMSGIEIRALICN